MKVQEQLALQCALMALQTRVLPLKGETATEFAVRLNGIGSGILAELLMDAAESDDDGGESDPVYTEADDQSEEFEPEETLTEGTRIRYYIDEDGQEDWYSVSEPSAKLVPIHACPHCDKTCSEAEVDAVFGFRNMKHVTSEGEFSVVRRQSWCRDCRLEALRQKQAARQEVTQELKKEFGIPAGMPPADFVKLFRVLSKGRSPLQVWLQNEAAMSKWGPITWSVAPKKPD